MKPRGLWWTFSTRKTPKTLHECAAGAGIKGCSTRNTVGVHRENEPQPHPCSAQFPPSSARNTAPVEPSLSRGSSWRSQEREDGKDRKTLWVENSQSRHLFLKKESTGHATSSPRVLSDLNSPLPNDQPLESSPSGEKTKKQQQQQQLLLLLLTRPRRLRSRSRALMAGGLHWSTFGLHQAERAVAKSSAGFNLLLGPRP